MLNETLLQMKEKKKRSERERGREGEREMERGPYFCMANREAALLAKLALSSHLSAGLSSGFVSGPDNPKMMLASWSI